MIITTLCKKSDKAFVGEKNFSLIGLAFLGYFFALISLFGCLDVRRLI